MDLSIVIPTYNRFESCRKLASSIDQQKWHKNVKFKIYDNASTDKRYEKLFEKISSKWEIIRRHSNIGYPASYNQIIYEIETKWLIVIGDDDSIKEDFAEKLQKLVSNINDKVIAIKTSCNLNKKFKQEFRDEEIHNLNELFTKISNPSIFSEFIFISTWVVNAQIFKFFLEDSNKTQSSMCTHLNPIFYGLRTGEYQILYRNVSIVNHNTPTQQAWSCTEIYPLLISTFIFSNLMKEDLLIRKLITGITGKSIYKILGFYIRILNEKDKFIARRLIKLLNVFGSKKHKLIGMVILIFPDNFFLWKYLIRLREK